MIGRGFLDEEDRKALIALAGKAQAELAVVAGRLVQIIEANAPRRGR